DDAKVLRAAYAYEKSSAWRERRPALAPGAPRVPITPAPDLSGVEVDDAMRRQVEEQTHRAGLTLNETQLALLCEVAPYAFAMAERVRGNHDRSDEPANVFDKNILDR